MTIGFVIAICLCGALIVAAVAVSVLMVIRREPGGGPLAMRALALLSLALIADIAAGLLA